MRRRTLTLIGIAGFASGASGGGGVTVDVHRTTWPVQGPGFTVDPSVRLADVDGDGHVDLVRGTEYRLNTGAGGFGPVESAGAGSSLADLDGDGDLDLALGSRHYVGEPSRVDFYWRERGSDGAYGPLETLPLPAVAFEDGSAFDVADSVIVVGDVDGDAENEFVRMCLEPYDDGSFRVLDYIERDPKSGATSVAVRGDLGRSDSSVDPLRIGPDLDGDGLRSSSRVDYVVRRGDSGGSTVIFSSPAGGTFVESLRILIGPNDVNDDRHSGYAVRGDGAARLAIFRLGNSGCSLGRAYDGVWPVGQILLTGYDVFAYPYLGCTPPSVLVDYSGLEFDPDGDGDSDLLAPIQYQIAGESGMRTRWVLFYNMGDEGFIGVFEPDVTGDAPLLPDSGVPGFAFGETVLADIDQDGVGELLAAGDGAVEVYRLSASALLIADLNGDGVVGTMDLGALLAGWRQPGPTDLDRDGSTGVSDLGILLASWG